MMRTQQKYRHHMFYIKDQNLKSLHKDLRHYNVTRYELAPKRHQVIKGSDRLDHTQKFSKNIARNFEVLDCRKEIMKRSLTSKRLQNLGQI